MAASNFPRCLASTLEFEGGFSNHPADPGGATMKGVTQRVYDEYRTRHAKPRQMVGYISDAEVRDIYKTGYWDKVFGDTLPAGVDLATFDFGVNSGPARANQYRNRLPSGKPSVIAKKLCEARLSYVRGLGTFRVFGKGWTRRITTIEARSVKMALEAEGKSAAQVSAELKIEGATAENKAKQQTGGTVGTGVGGGMLAGMGGYTGWIIGAIVVIGVVLIAYRAWINHQRAKAYEAVANEGAVS